MAIEAIVGSIYRPTKNIVLYKKLLDAINVLPKGLNDITVTPDNSIMYVDIELYSWGPERRHICKVLYDNNIWYIFNERDVERLG